MCRQAHMKGRNTMHDVSSRQPRFKGENLVVLVEYLGITLRALKATLITPKAIAASRDFTRPSGLMQGKIRNRRCYVHSFVPASSRVPQNLTHRPAKPPTGFCAPEFQHDSGTQRYIKPVHRTLPKPRPLGCQSEEGGITWKVGFFQASKPPLSKHTVNQSKADLGSSPVHKSSHSMPLLYWWKSSTSSPLPDSTSPNSLHPLRPGSRRSARYSQKNLAWNAAAAQWWKLSDRHASFEARTLWSSWRTPFKPAIRTAPSDPLKLTKAGPRQNSFWEANYRGEDLSWLKVNLPSTDALESVTVPFEYWRWDKVARMNWTVRHQCQHWLDRRRWRRNYSQCQTPPTEMATHPTNKRKPSCRHSASRKPL